MKFVLVLLCIAQTAIAHQVWSWLALPNTEVLFNQYNWQSVEQVCFPVSQGTNNVKICTSGQTGWKCIAMYASSDCTNETIAGVTWHPFSMWNTGGDFCAEINFEGTDYSTILDIELALMPVITGIEIGLADANSHTTGSTFNCFSVKTYNC
jgi:hypothetical protein